jgi:hypothetical protein
MIIGALSIVGFFSFRFFFLWRNCVQVLGGDLLFL